MSPTFEERLHAMEVFMREYQDKNAEGLFIDDKHEERCSNCWIVKAPHHDFITTTAYQHDAFCSKECLKQFIIDREDY